MTVQTPDVDDLKLILEVPADVTDDTLELYVDMAKLVVTEDLAGKGLSEARLSKIWLLLSAHYTLMTTERGGLTSSRTGDQSQETYGGDKVFKEGLSMTRFGHQAIALDTSNTLSAMASTKKSALFRTVTTPTEKRQPGYRYGSGL